MDKTIHCGVKEAGADIYIFYAKKIFNFLLKKDIPANQAKDICQEIIIAAIYQSDLKEIENPDRYIMGIYRNKLNDYFKGDKTESLTEINEDFIAIENIKPHLEQIITGEELSMLENALNELSKEEQEIIILTFHEGLKSPEIGDKLGLKANTVRQKLVRALAKLRKKLS